MLEHIYPPNIFENITQKNIVMAMSNNVSEMLALKGSMLGRGFAHLHRQPDLLIGFFHAAGLFVRQNRLT